MCLAIRTKLVLLFSTETSSTKYNQNQPNKKYLMNLESRDVYKGLHYAIISTFEYN